MENSRIDLKDIGIDPFLNCLTIASFCNTVYRYKHLIPETICIIADNGLNPHQRTSDKCNLWLGFIENRDKIIIKQSRTIGGEKKIGIYFCDGFDEINKTIYEFNGCYW
jgi:hypothetical protein